MRMKYSFLHKTINILWKDLILIGKFTVGITGLFSNFISRIRPAEILKVLLYMVLANTYPYQMRTMQLSTPVFARNVPVESISIDLEPIRVNPPERTIDEMDVLQLYQYKGGNQYVPYIEPYIPLIDKVLREYGLENDTTFIRVMFYIGQHESHWTASGVDSFSIAGEHPTGIFQFLPSTFKSVSKGNIFNPEDQIRAYIEMSKRGRIKEFQTLFVCGWKPCIDNADKIYMLNFAKKS